MKRLAIVVPVYNEHPKEYENYSMHTLYNALPDVTIDYDLILVKPQSMDAKEYHDILHSVALQDLSFDDEYFDSTESYSRLLTNISFYERLSDYEYIMIFQTDCIAMNFRNIERWVNEGYDYVGAPIISSLTDWPNAPTCGNGGLSLRRVSKFIQVLSNKTLADEIKSKSKSAVKYEDVFWCVYVPQYIYMSIPYWKKASSFSWDMNPDRLCSRYHLDDNIKDLVGVHAFPKNVPFWKDKVDIPEDVYNECYENNHVFIDIYYKN